MTKKVYFFEYIKTFQGLKQEASGYPEWAVDEKSKKEYREKYKEREGVTLQDSHIKYNSGLRGIEKLKLNNLWGKFGNQKISVM